MLDNTLTGNAYFVVVHEYNEKPTLVGLYASVMKVSRGRNLFTLFNSWNKVSCEKVKSVNLCRTKKEAQELSDFWNQCYKDNGTYAFK